jgi:hypothetical protein
MATTSAFTNIPTGLKQNNNHPLDGRTHYKYLLIVPIAQQAR